MNNQRIDDTSHERGLLIRRAELLEGGIWDLRLADGRIVEKSSRLTPQADDLIINADGCLLLPGLQDHHLHLFATASARASVQCGPPTVTNETELRQALQAAPGSGWLRGVGFHDSVCDRLNRDWLDKACPDRPIRIQHRSGMMWVLNSCALNQLRLESEDNLPKGVEREGQGGSEADSEGRLTGRFFDLDTWLSEHLPRAWPSLETLSKDLAAFGITGLTDTGVNNDANVWAALCAASDRGVLMQRTLVMGSEAMNLIEESDSTRMSIGPLKLYLREADLPDLDVFTQRIRASHQLGRAVAVHCVTRVEMIFLLEAFTQAGVLTGDRIEHASIADDDIAERMAKLGIIAVTQPHFIAERGDQYLKDVDPDDLPWLYRGQGFLNQGVRLAAGSDAPYGSINPWASMQAAVSRTTGNGKVMGAEERLSPLQALALFGGTASQPGNGFQTLEVGSPADVCLLNVTKAQFSEAVPDNPVILTISDGKIIFQASPDVVSTASQGNA
ncbi:amidohydrolase [Pseudomaricurvus sp.]|uniref:amidohydrolase n=1 Tax=Pseudomaricurvus sp. TaxID=2004510 RepID=UPI003F6D517D